ncbi:MAG: alpha/beta hydrolase [Clostridia bacterium]|nr:alpha/beta hydrolase [Clostridia bacterium]
MTLTAYIQDVGGEYRFSRRPAMLVLPGGGYSFCSDREADPIALAYLNAGYHAFILRYTLKSVGGWPCPLEDCDAAMALLEEKADEWNIEPGKIAVSGFSAGGHLAACAATLGAHRPAAAVLVYPVILQDIADACQPGMPAPHEHVTADTCPCFIAHARDDSTVDIHSALAMATALADAGVPFEAHVYSRGGHGFSTGSDWIYGAPKTERLSDWVEDSIGWLDEILGKLTQRGMTPVVF